MASPFPDSWLRGQPFTVSAAVGFVALSGAVILNRLVRFSFIKPKPESGALLRPALRVAASAAASGPDAGGGRSDWAAAYLP